MKEKIILIGGGGHCKACIDVIEAENKFKIAGIVDAKEKVRQKIFSYEVIACDEELDRLIEDYRYFLITIGQIKSSDKRKEKFVYLKKIGARFPVIVSPCAYVSKYAVVGEGTIIMHKAIVNAQATIGVNCIINTASIIEHDSVIGNHCHISTGSIINGRCRVGDRSFIGSKSVLVNDIGIDSDVVIGAGSVVVKSVDKKGVFSGNPLRGRPSHE